MSILMVVLAGAALAFGVYPPQVTQVEGKVTLKQADGTVTVNGTSAISGVVSLGKLGRVELKSETTLKLSYTDSSFKLTTDDGEIVSTGPTKVDVKIDTHCGNTLVAVKKGKVELRAGNSVKQIAAGSQDAAGQAMQGCR
jgi:ferric-dicitrate binding protein FerR (iron transport regulator)